MRQGYRQEVFNVLLAQLLQERGNVSAPEDVLKTSEGRRMPDVMVDFSGLRTIIEGEVDDQPGAETRASVSAASRVETGIAHIGIAIVYPASLRSVPFEQLKDRVASCSLRIMVVTEAGTMGFVDGTVDELADILRHTFDQLVQEDVVARAVEALDAGIEQFSGVVSSNTGMVARVAGILGIRELPSKAKPTAEENEE
jgi:hypothetical protein